MSRFEWSMVVLVFLVLLAFIVYSIMVILGSQAPVKAAVGSPVGLTAWPNCAGLKDPPPAFGPAPKPLWTGTDYAIMVGPRMPEVVPLYGEGSMIPVADSGHYLIVLPVPFEGVQINHYGLFRSPLVSKDLVVFHQVIGRGKDGKGPFLWTRGIANCTADMHLVRKADWVGVVAGVWWGAEEMQPTGFAPLDGK